MTELRTNFRLPVVVLVLLLFLLMSLVQALIAQEKDPYEVDRLSRRPTSIIPLPLPPYSKDEAVFDKTAYLQNRFSDRRAPKGPDTGPVNKPKAGYQGGDVIPGVPIGSLPYSTTGTTTGFNNDYSEGFGADNAPDVVYSYAPSTTTTVNISLCGSFFDTKLIVYENSATPGAPYAFNDDDCSLQSEIPGLSLTGGNTYYIIVDGYGSNFGDYVINVDEVAPNVPCGVVCPGAAVAEGEACTGAPPDLVNGGCNSTPEVYGTINEGEDICGLLWADADFRDLDWYLHTITSDSTITLTGTADLPFLIAILEHNDGCPIDLPDEEVAATSGAPCATVSITATLPPGDYIFLIAPDDVFNGYPCTEDWKYVLGYTGVPFVPPPTPDNNDCVDATPVGDVVDLAWSTIDATASGEGNYIASPDVFYCYTASCTGLATFSLCGSGFDTRIAVYDGCSCPVGPELGTDDFSCDPGLQSEVILPVVTGQQYLVQVGGYQQNVGSGILNISCLAGGLPNDDCADAVEVFEGVTAFNNIGATTDGDQHAECGFGDFGADVWFTYTATCTGNLFVNTNGSPSSFDTKLAIYADDASCPPTTLIDCDDDGGVGTRSEIVLPVVAATSYIIRVGGYNGDQDFGELSIECLVPPPNDNCEDVTPVVLTDGVTVTFNGDNTNATNQCEDFPGNHVWEAFTIVDTCMQVTLDYCGTSPAFQNAWLNLAFDCPCTDFTPAGEFSILECTPIDGNVSVTWSSLLPGTYYYPVLSEELSVGPYQINVLAEITECLYCEASSSICDEYIARVELGDIDNSSDCGNYEDYTHLSTVLWKTVDYDLTVENGVDLWSTDRCVTWIDWNHDFDFDDPGEEITMTGSPGIGPYTAVITPPPGAVVGPTVMRVAIKYDPPDPEPCGTFTFGEVEDYTVIIGEFVCGDANENDIPAEIADVVALGEFYFNASTSWPDPLFEVDVNCDGCVGLADLVYLADFIHRNGDDLCCIPW